MGDILKSRFASPAADATTVGARIGRDSGYLLGSNLTLLLTSLATGILTARVLGPAGKGQFYLLLQLATTISLVATLGLGPSYQYHLTKGLLTRSAALSHLLGVSSVLLVALATLYAYGQHLLRWASHGELSAMLLGMVCVTTFACAEILLAGWILGAMPSGVRANSFLGVASSALYLGFLCVFVWLLRWGVAGAISAYLVSTGVRLAATFYLVTRSPWHGLTLRWWTPGRSLFAFGGRLFMMNLMVTSLFRVDVFIVNNLLGSTLLGVYSVAVSFAEMVLMGPNALGTSLFRHLPSATPDERLLVLGQSSRIILAAALVMGFGTAICSYPLIVLLMGARFRGAVGPLILLIPGLVAVSVAYVYSNFYAASGRPLVSTKAYGAGMAVNVVLNLGIIPLFGISGAAMASTVAYVSVSAVFVHFLRRDYGVSVRDLVVPRREDVLLVRNKMACVLKGTATVPERVTDQTRWPGAETIHDGADTAVSSSR